MRPIDADAMHKFVADKVAEGKDGWANGVGYEWTCILTAVDMQPTIDAVEVCRCKYCKHRTLAGKAPFMFFLCSHNNGLRENVKDNDFCSYGERKEGEHDQG